MAAPPLRLFRRPPVPAVCHGSSQLAEGSFVSKTEQQEARAAGELFFFCSSRINSMPALPLNTRETQFLSLSLSAAKSNHSLCHGAPASVLQARASAYQAQHACAQKNKERERGAVRGCKKKKKAAAVFSSSFFRRPPSNWKQSLDQLKILSPPPRREAPRRPPSQCRPAAGHGQVSPHAHGTCEETRHRGGTQNKKKRGFV